MSTALDHVSRGLRILRKEQGLSQAKLAEAAEVSTKLISAIEQGERAPSFATLDKLCMALRVSPTVLFEVGRPCPDPAARGVAERLGSMLVGLDEAQERHMLAVVRGVREMLLDEAKKRGEKKNAPAKKRGRYGKSPGR